MIRSLTMIAACLAAAVLAPVVRGDEPAEKRAVDSTAFAADLYGRLDTGGGNVFFSPMSIESALAMTYAGAKGPTADQMAKALHFNQPAADVNAAFAGLLKTLNSPPEITGMDPDTGKQIKKPAYALVVANALWGQNGYPFQPAFIQMVQKDYGGALTPVDFGQPEAARKAINDWVATQTKDKIKDLIGEGALNAQTRLVLTNAIYFKSNWEHEFSKSATKDGTFHLSAEKTVEVPLMHQTHSFGYAETDTLQLLEMPYAQSELSMVVLLPKKVDGLEGVEKTVTAAKLRDWFKSANQASVEVTLPKFTFSAQFELGETLKGMGMTDAFNPDKADFSGMTTAEKLSISGVIHKAFVAVDEDGTEAAAATAVMMRSLAMRRPEEPKVFNADHPFIFVIRHNATGEILFMGRLANPKGE